jgi:hypothetical protein
MHTYMHTHAPVAWATYMHTYMHTHAPVAWARRAVARRRGRVAGARGAAYIHTCQTWTYS